jgi:hypothetical protein
MWTAREDAGLLLISNCAALQWICRVFVLLQYFWNLSSRAMGASSNVKFWRSHGLYVPVVVEQAAAAADKHHWQARQKRG